MNITYISAIYNLIGDFEVIKLGKNIEIRKMSTLEKESLVNNLRKTQPEAIKQIEIFNYALFIYENQPSKRFNEQTIIDKVILALRLYKGELVDYHFCYKYSGDITITTYLGGFEQNWKFGRIGSSVNIKKNEVDSFIAFWNQFEKVKIDKDDVLLHRYNRSFLNDQLNDSIIDYLIIMEGIVGDNQGKIAYKLGMRSSFLLNLCFNDNRCESYGKIKKAYSDIRCNVLHGGKTKIKRDDQEHFFFFLRDFARKLLAVYIFNKDIFKNVKLIDNAINTKVDFEIFIPSISTDDLSE